MSTSTIRVHDAEVRRALRDFAKRGSDGTQPFRWFHAWWILEVGKAWGKIDKAGGFFRGRMWSGMKARYTRATDGVTVYPWGGVSKAKGRGKVKGAKVGKTKGVRMKRTDILMQDTRNMAKSITGPPVQLTKEKLVVGPTGVSEKYADVQDAMRPVVFWAPEDEPKMMAFFRKFIDQEIARFNR